jgi:C-terminal processing protease CtpA/Prc
MKQRWWLILAVAVLSFFSGGWLLQQGVQNDGGVYRQARLFDEVMSHVQAYYVDSLGEANLYNKATEGLLDQLQDPYSVLLQGESYQALNETTTGNYGGLGIQIDVRDGWIAARYAGGTGRRRTATRSSPSTASRPKVGRTTRPCGRCAGRPDRRSS